MCSFCIPSESLLCLTMFCLWHLVRHCVTQSILYSSLIAPPLVSQLLHHHFSLYPLTHTWESKMLARAGLRGSPLTLNRFLRTNAALVFLGGGTAGAAFAFARTNGSTAVRPSVRLWSSRLERVAEPLAIGISESASRRHKAQRAASLQGASSLSLPVFGKSCSAGSVSTARPRYSRCGPRHAHHHHAPPQARLDAQHHLWRCLARHCRWYSNLVSELQWRHISRDQGPITSLTIFPPSYVRSQTWSQ